MKSHWLFGGSAFAGLLCLIAMYRDVPAGPAADTGLASSDETREGQRGEQLAEPPRAEPEKKQQAFIAEEPRSISSVRRIGELLTLNSTESREIVFWHLLPELVSIDPAAAISVADEIPIESLKIEYLQHLGRAWIERDADSAMAWAAELSKRGGFGEVLAQMTLGLAQSDPRRAMLAAAKLGLASDCPETQTLAELWAERDLPGALRWLSAQEAGAARDRATAGAVLILARTSPAEAADLVAMRMGPGPARTEAAISVAHEWALCDPAAASRWVERFPAGSLQGRARDEINGLTRMGATPSGSP